MKLVALSFSSTLKCGIAIILLWNLIAFSQISQAEFENLFEQIQKKNEWNLNGEPELITGRDFLETGQEFAESMMEYKMELGYAARFESSRDSVRVNLSVFRAPTQISAFGFYSSEKSPSLEFQDLGFQAYSSGKRLKSWYGKYVVICQTPDTLEEHSKYTRELAQEIIRLLPKQKRYTPILDALPDRDRVEHSEKFYARRWLDQDYFQNIYYADYYTPDGYSRIFIINNPSTAAADSNFWKYYSFIKIKAEILPNDLKLATDYYVVEEPLWGRTILAKKNQIIYGILDYRNKEWTEDRLDEILTRLKKRKIVKSG